MGSFFEDVEAERSELVRKLEKLGNRGSNIKKEKIEK
jgi:hypothetical protein